MKALGSISLSLVALTTSTVGALAISVNGPTRYTWVLPRTVLDTTITYSFQDCAFDASKNTAIARFKITPTLAPRPIADMRSGVGQRSLPVDQFQSFLKDEGVSIETFKDSHILSSIGSQPADQTGTIIGNVIGGVTKLVSVAAGVGAIAAAPGAPAPAKVTCKADTDAGSAPQISSQIKQLKALINSNNEELATGLDENKKPLDNSAQKKLMQEIQSAQALITDLQGRLSFAIKTTIDPGVSPINVDPDNETTSFMLPSRDGRVNNSGLIATICPSTAQFNKLKIFDNLPNENLCSFFPTLKVSVYLDFPSGHSSMYSSDHHGDYEQTELVGTQLYRDPAYIPVQVWQGEKKAGAPEKREDGSVIGDVLLMAPVTLPFAQFGVAQSLPLEPQSFQQLTWSITFLEDGQITKASYTTKATGVGLSSLFGTAASGANSIATELRNASNSSAAETEATKLQGQADYIYQTHRLESCAANPSTCSQK